MKRLVACALAFVFFLALPAAAADPFYDDLERQGLRATARGDFERAAKLLRLAAFGLLEEPPRLAACLAHLMTAQAEAGDEDGFHRSFQRLLEVERRFAGYSRADLTARSRARLEDHLERLVSHELLLSSSMFRAVEVRLDAVAARIVEEAREVSAGGSLDELIEIFSRLRRVAEEYPDHGGVQHLAGELAYRVKLWPESRNYFERGGEIAKARPDLRFYYAVVLFETGDVLEAAAVLEECLPGLTVDDFIRDYAERIRRAAAD